MRELYGTARDPPQAGYRVGGVTHVVNAIWLTGSFPVRFRFAGNRVSHPLEPSGGPR